MAERKTQETDASVDDFLAAVAHDRRRADSLVVLEMMRRVTGWEPRMWGTSIVGFGRYRYKDTKGREHGFFHTGFSPRKAALTVYIMPGFGAYGALMKRLGKHKTGRSCLYITKLDDVDLGTLEALIRESVDWMKEKYG